jgi:hypothetical protein
MIKSHLIMINNDKQSLQLWYKKNSIDGYEHNCPKNFTTHNYVALILT